MNRNARDVASQSNRPLLDMAETADRLRVSKSHIYRLIKQGALKPVKLGGRTLFRRIDLDALIDRSVVA